MAIKINGKTIRNIPEQVAKNLHDIDTLDESVESVATDIGLLAARVAAALTGVFHYKGTVATYADLPSSGMQVGDTYNVSATGDNYTWSGSSWDKLSGIVDLSNYLNKSSTNQSIASTASYNFDIGASVKFNSAGDQYRVMAIGTALDISAYNGNQWKSYIAIDSDREAQSTTFNSYVDFTDDVDFEGVVSLKSIESYYSNFPISLGSDIVPISANEIDLGNSTYTWKDIYLNDHIYIKSLDGNNTFFVRTTNSGNLSINDQYYFGGSALFPAAAKDLGLSSFKWSNLHLSGKINPNSNGYGLSIPNTASLIADSEIVDTNSNQFISGKKTTKEINFVNNVASPIGNTLSIVNDNGYNAKIRMGNNGFIFTANMVGAANEGMDLGSASSYRFGTIYLTTGISNGTDNVSITDLAALIAYARTQGWIS